MCAFTDLDAIELTKVIMDAFPEPVELDMFIGGTGNFEDIARVVDMSLGYEARVFKYITTYLMPRAVVDLFLENLEDKFLEQSNEPYLIKVQCLVDPNRINQPIYLNFYSGSNVPFNPLKKNVFGDWFKDYYSITKSDMWAGASDRTKCQIDSSKFYVAVIGQNAVTRPRPANDPIFNYAFNAWVQSLSLPPQDRKRFIVLLTADGYSWWEKWKEDHKDLEVPGGGSVFEETALFVQECRLEPAFYARGKEILEKFLEAPIRPRVKLSNVVVLGDPLGKKVDNTVGAEPSDEVQLLDYLRKYRPDHVHHWADGWAGTIKLDIAQRAKLLEHPPIFVRSVCDREVSAARLKDALMVPLMNALGYIDDLGPVWKNTVGQYRRLYWRREGPWIDGSPNDQDIEMTWNGTAKDVSERLAAMAGFGRICESRLRTRFEDLPDTDPYRELLSEGLRAVGQGVVEPQEFETVAIAFDSLDESISLFDRSELNIVAAHDQRTRPGDKAHTIEHFQSWDSRIDQYVREFFPQRQPKILRVAVLFQNFDKFDGLRFDEGLTIRRWKLLKAKRDDNNAWILNPKDVDRLEEAARDLLRH